MPHCYLFAVLPLVYLYTRNIHELPAWHIAVIGGVLCGLTATLIWMVRLVSHRSYKKYCLCISAWWLMFWGAIPFLKALQIDRLSFLPMWVVAHKWVLLLLSVGIGVVFVGLWLWRSQSEFVKLHRTLNVFSGIMCVVLCVQLAGMHVTDFINSRKGTSKTLQQASPTGQHPNIYHIVLDAYTSAESLREGYRYDNSEFYRELERLGFVCVQNSYSNYPSTEWSMTSILNMDYVDSSRSWSLFMPQMGLNKVWDCLEQRQYKLWLLDQSTLYHRRDLTVNIGDSNFIKTLLCVTALTPVKHMLEGVLLEQFHCNHIDNIDNIFSWLTSSISRGANNNCFHAHILSPHEPLVFDEYGNLSGERTFKGFLAQKLLNMFPTPEEQEDFERRYVNQVRAISRRTLDAVQKILAQYPKDRQPVIIIHGDHGKSSAVPVFSEWEKAIESRTFTAEQRAAFGNLLALYVPEHMREEARHLSLVNVYRFLFNHLFGEKLPYLEAMSYYPGIATPIRWR
jgi:hypothetical protein